MSGPIIVPIADLEGRSEVTSRRWNIRSRGSRANRQLASGLEKEDSSSARTLQTIS